MLSEEDLTVLRSLLTTNREFLTPEEYTALMAIDVKNPGRPDADTIEYIRSKVFNRIAAKKAELLAQAEQIRQQLQQQL